MQGGGMGTAGTTTAALAFGGSTPAKTETLEWNKLG